MLTVIMNLAYRLAVPHSLRHCTMFILYLLQHYVSYPTNVIDMSSLQVLDEGALTTKPIHFLYPCIRQLRL
jgi:hypothetical protein